MIFYSNLSPAIQKRKYFANVLEDGDWDVDVDVDVWTWPFNQAHIARQVILCAASHFSLLTDQFSRLSTKFHRKIIALGTQPENQSQAQKRAPDSISC